MSKYDIFQNADSKKLGIRITRGSKPDLYFAGYDFMGSVDWSTNPEEMYCCDGLNEARSIVNDLELAD